MIKTILETSLEEVLDTLLVPVQYGYEYVSLYEIERDSMKLRRKSNHEIRDTCQAV